MFDFGGISFLAVVGVLSLIGGALWLAYTLGGWVGMVLAAVLGVVLIGLEGLG